ncbi:hypothetical protein DFJ63DRAFT_317632 [Scheffersomyces coipomensis]|uniref:uncharacterized protein n=1 Tax=Scheffersomyces coipomensis TaxID=1788519 RepID=UPI00315D8906
MNDIDTNPNPNSNSYINHQSAATSTLLQQDPSHKKIANSFHNIISSKHDYIYHHNQLPHHLQQQSPSLPFNSEWLDSPNNSPSKSSTAPNSNMSSTIITSKYETPQPKKVGGVVNAATFNYITPTSENKIVDVLNVVGSSTTNNSTTTIKSTSSKKVISNWDIIWSMLNDIVGKDKMAKIGQYTLRLLIYHANQVQTNLSDDDLNIKFINNKFQTRDDYLQLIKQSISQPRDFLKIIIILLCSIFKMKFSGLITGLSMYRQFLRFGKTPFRIRDLINKFSSNIQYNKDSKLTINYDALVNKKTLGQFFSLYYGINDESLLLFKMKFFTNKKLYSIVSRHESLGWYCETWLAMYNCLNNLSALTQQEMDLKIQIQVRNKAKILSKQLLRNSNVNSNSFDFSTGGGSSSDDQEDLRLLKEVRFKMNNCYLDVYKNLSDLIFNSYTVFRLKLPFDTLQIWMGISAASLSTIKLYRETKKKLIEKQK